MRISLGPFARSGIESQLGPDVEGAVQAALCHYSGKVKSGRAPLGPPPVASGGDRADSLEAFDLAVDPEVEALLEGEAKRQGLEVSRLAAHSVLVYLAELDFLYSSSRPV